MDYHCCKRIDLIAHKIRDLVREHVVENPPLVRAAWQGYIIRPRRGHGNAAVKHDAKPLASVGRPGHHILSRSRCGEDESVRFRGKMELG